MYFFLILAMTASKRDLDVEEVLSAKQMMNPEVPHIGVMAYAAWHKHVLPVEAPVEEEPPQPEVVMVEAIPEPEPEPEPPEVEEESVEEEEEEDVVDEAPQSPEPEPEETPAPIPVILPLVVAPPSRDSGPKVSIRRKWLIHMQQTLAVTFGSSALDRVTSTASHDDRSVPLTVTRVDTNLHYVHFLPTLKGWYFFF